MTDQTPDRPGGRPERPLPARRPSGDLEAAPTRPVERFTASRQTRAIAGLTPERAAKIVRQTGDARWVAFLGLVIVALFVIVYYFYELGLPFGLSQARLDSQDELQQVTAVERGYNLYQANCARCHGPNGEGGIGPLLNDNMKLYQHLSEAYIRNVLEVGGRYVCGDPKSIMPVWAEKNGGPLNYVQIEDLIAFLRAPDTQEYQKRDPELNEPILDADGKVQTFKGWRNVDFKPEPDATPVPDCYKGDRGSATPAPQATLGPDATILDLTAVDVAFETQALTAPAGEAFGVHFVNEGGLEHDMDIRQAAGQPVLVDNPEILTGETDYTISALEPGTYNFFCSIHDIPAMNGTLTVE